MKKTVADEFAEIPPEMRTDMRIAGLLAIWLTLKKSRLAREALAAVLSGLAAVVILNTPQGWKFWCLFAGIVSAAFTGIWIGSDPKKRRK